MVGELRHSAAYCTLYLTVRSDVSLPQQWPLVDEMRTVKKLSVVTGGNYHLAKFLPVMGRLAVNLYNEKIDKYLQCMRWERHEQVALHEAIVPFKQTS